MKPVFSTLIIALGLGSIASLAAAEDVCMPQGEMKAALFEWYDERPVAEPGDDNRQIWASTETGTWTMVEYQSGGTACVVAQGNDWMGNPEDAQRLASLQQ